MSPRIVSQITLVDGADGRDQEEARDVLRSAGAELPGVTASHAGIHFDYSVGGGDLTWDLAVADANALAALCERLKQSSAATAVDALGDGFKSIRSRVASMEFAIPDEIDGRVGVPGLVGVKRTLWLRVMPGTPAREVARFEAETPLLAEAIPAIRNWRWSRVRTTDPNPMTLRWTHLWEQEFETEDGLQIDYMMSPCHWGYIDRWFDPEMPDCIVDVWLAHLACPASAPVLSGEASR